MRSNYLLILLCLCCLGCQKDKPEETKRKLLVLTKTAGFRHESIEAGIAMFETKKADWRLDLTVTDNTAMFTGNNLNKYHLLVLLHTTGDFLDSLEQLALQAYMQQGGRILAIHAAADAEYNWPWYGQMLGARFDSHPHIQEAELQSTAHPAASALPALWTRTDEWYNFRDLDGQNDPVLLLNEQSYQGGTNGAHRPISWSRTHDGGRVFYTGLGHTAGSYTELLFMQHIEGAVDWLMEE